MRLLSPRPVAALAVLLALSSPARAQAPVNDLRDVHERAVYATVRIASRHVVGSGWLLQQSGRPLIITNRHVAETVGVATRSQAWFYTGAGQPEVSVPVQRVYLSRTVDLGILELTGDPPPQARPIALRATTTVTRGERVVLSGNPSAGNGVVLRFQTTEGVVTGHVAGSAYRECGRGRNCLVVDAASFRGSSGGLALNSQGEVVGMLWGGPSQAAPTATTRDYGVALVQNPSFSYLIHVATIATELRALGG